MASDRHAEEPDYGDDIDPATFEQILEMDDEDDETREFSSSIVLDFFQQAGGTFMEMDKAVKAEDLTKLSELGHFLKGSSATLGLTKVKDACEKIQNWGHRKDDNGDTEISSEDALKRIRDILPAVKADCKTAEKVLMHFYR